MTTVGPYDIVEGPPEHKLRDALIIRDSGRRTVDFTFFLAGGTRVVLPVTVDTLCHGVALPSDWCVAGVGMVESIGHELARETLRQADLRQLARPFRSQPYYRAVYSTNIRTGKLYLMEEPLISHELR